MDSIIDKIFAAFDPLVNYSSKSYDNNYIFYFGFGAVILLIAAIFYIFFRILK